MNTSRSRRAAKCVGAQQAARIKLSIDIGLIQSNESDLDGNVLPSRFFVRSFLSLTLLHSITYA